MDDRIITYAQNKEDIILSGFFGEDETGFYVDIGASHPVVSSVTKYFYERGWHGINIEPNKKQWKLLEEDRPDDINVQVGISDKKGTLEFREYEGYGLSTFSKEIKKDNDKKGDPLTRKYKDYTVPVTTLRDVFTAHKVKKISFLKIDIEGLEYEALIGNDWERFRPEVICIESNHIVKDWRPLLEKYKYEKVFFDGLNDYYVAKEHTNRAKSFSYVDTLLLSKPVIPLYWHQQLGKSERLRARREAELRGEKLRAHELKQGLIHMTAELHQQRRTVNLVKRVFRNIDARIIATIQNLDKPRIKKTRNSVVFPEIELDARNKQQIREHIAQNDLANFYTNDKSRGYKKNYTHKIMHGTYFGIRSLLRGVFRLIKGIARKVMGRR